jgi:hypothetical protein
MTGWDVAQAVLDLIAANAGALNANAHLAATNYRVSTEAEDADGSTDAFKFLKLDDRDNMPDGLNIFATFGQDRDERRFSQFLVHKACTVYVMAYFAGATTADGVGIADPAQLVKAKRGVTEGLVSLLNRSDLQCGLPSGAGTIWNGRVTDALYALAPKPSMGVFVPGIQLTYECIYAVQETATDGAMSAG